MTEQAHNRAFDLFHKIRALPPDECSSSLEEACKGDSELRDQVLRLIAATKGCRSIPFSTTGPSIFSNHLQTYRVDIRNRKLEPVADFNQVRS